MNSGKLSLHYCFAADWASLNIMTRLACLVPLPPVPNNSARRWRRRMVANVLSMALVVRRCLQRSAGKS